MSTATTTTHPLDALRSRKDADKGFEFEDLLEAYIREV